jgi:hypothetical protein
MFGCLRRLGCLVILGVVAVMLYFNQDAWLPRLRALTGRAAPAEAPPAATADGGWEPITSEGAARGRARVQSLAARGGPAYTNLAAADLASYVYDELRRQLPPSAERVEAAVFGDQLHVRTVVRLADLGGARVLGPLAQFLSERDTVQFGGTFDVVRPGLAEFRVRTIKLRQLSIPSRLVPQILSQVSREPRPEGVAADALPLAIPSYVSDVRITRGRVTVYKAVP